ncbi:MAG TPA: hypothetical protein VGW34_11500 [Allosphingosinicella sp.]|nr:hypothetical protein [Allosphingosinicella sp.]
MGPGFYIMAILGCGEADTACQQVAVTESRYETVEACNAATADAVMRNSDLAFPVVVAQCRPANAPASDTLMPEQVDLPEPGQKPRIERASIRRPKLAKL